MPDDIRHRIRVTVSSDSPESRALGILKVVRILKAAGVHLVSGEVSRDTADRMIEITDTVLNDTPASAILAVVCDNQNPPPTGTIFDKQ